MKAINMRCILQNDDLIAMIFVKDFFHLKLIWKILLLQYRTAETENSILVLNRNIWAKIIQECMRSVREDTKFSFRQNRRWKSRNRLSCCLCVLLWRSHYKIFRVFMLKVEHSMYLIWILSKHFKSVERSHRNVRIPLYRVLLLKSCLWL